MSIFETLHDSVINRIAKQSPSHLHYHNVGHTKQVIKNCIFLAEKMQISQKDTELLKIAALYHDLGFIKSHINHEAISCQMARKELAELKVGEDKIAVIEGIIMATKLPNSPTTKLQKIIADADLFYLGTIKYQDLSDQLKKEMDIIFGQKTDREWIDLQIEFLLNHQYYTPWCLRFRETPKKRHISSLRFLLE
jgi:uncharacterized protein